MPDEVVSLALELAAVSHERDNQAKHNNDLQREIAELRKVASEVGHVKEDYRKSLVAVEAAETNARHWQVLAGERDRELVGIQKERDAAVTRAEQYKVQLAELRDELTEERAGATFSSAVAESQRKRADATSTLLDEARAEVQAGAALRAALRPFLED